MSKADCTRAEVLAGAIALGEASDGERDDYRRHLSTCARCLDAFGGEREIERVMVTVSRARDEESWEPDVAGLVARRRTAGRRTWKFGLSAAAIAIVASLGIHALLAANVQSMAPLASTGDSTVAYSGPHITLEKMPAGMSRTAHNQPATVAAASKPRADLLVVQHNVVELKRPAAAAGAPVSAPAKPQPAARPADAGTEPAQIAAVTPSESQRDSIAALKTGSGSGREAGAESMAVMPNAMSVRDVSPIGGEKAIVPHPSSIAYDEGAEGTTAYEVIVDERGNPLRCTIAKSSGYLVLDEAVCNAAMRARFTPRTINGKAVVGVYKDAFVFRANENP